MRGIPIKRQYLVKAIGLIILLIILIRVDLRQVIQLLGDSRYGFLLPVIVLIMPQVALRALRWQRLLAQSGIQCPFPSALHYYFAAIYIGLITPGRIGEMAKGYFLKQDGSADLVQSLPSVLFDRILDLYFLVMLSVAALYFFQLVPMAAGTAATILLTLGSLPWILIKWLAAEDRVAGGIAKMLGRIDKRCEEAWEAFMQGARQLVSARLFESLLWTALSYVVYFVQIYMLGWMIDLPLSAGDLILAVVIGILVGFAPITVAGLGTREAVLLFLFGRFGVSAPLTLSFAFLYNFVYIVCVGVISAGFWIFLPQREGFKTIERA